MKRTRRTTSSPPPSPPPPQDPGKDQDAETLSLPPHSLEAEQGVLGCILLDPQASISQCVSALKPGGQVFYDLRHRTIYEMCVARWDQQKPIDIITLQQALRDAGCLDGIGGLVYLSSLPDVVPSAANLPSYLEIVLKKFIIRRVLDASVQISDAAKGEPENVAELVAASVARIESIGDATVQESEASTPKTLVPEALGYIEHLELNAGKVTGLATGLVDLDMLTWGLQAKELFILAARPSVGKTALAMNIADHIATQLKVPVGIFSLEMSKSSLMVRMLCAKAGVDMVAVRRGQLSAAGRDKLLKAGYELRKAPIIIDDTSGISILQLRSRARRMVKQHGIKIVIVDYLQLMTAATRRNDNRQQEVANICSGLKGLSKEENVAVLALSQISRKMEDRGANAKPKLSDLRESGSIEQDADVVTLLYRQKDDSEHAHANVVNVRVEVAKNRNGPTGEVDLVFLKHCTRFQSAAHTPAPPNEPDPTLL